MDRNAQRPMFRELLAERQRLAAARDGNEPWYRWGPYLAERQ